MRKKIIAGNWKMNMLPNEAMEFIKGLEQTANKSNKEIILFVPYTDLFYSLMTAQGTKIRIGAQNMHWEEKGAYTGEISAPMLKGILVKNVLIGHSERRQYFGETDETVNNKIKTALKNEINPILCVGETLKQRENGETETVIKEQIELALRGVEGKEIKNITIAYEPIWAIGTGKTATPEDANKTIKIIRKDIEKLYTKDIAEEISILYGGSVNEKNAKELFETSDIDGALVGGASLKLQEFINIINS